MRRTLLLLLVGGFLAVPAFAEPRMWADDFTVEATYDYASWMGSCYGSPTKYTAFDVLLADLATQRTISGGGRLSYFTNDPTVSFSIASVEPIIVGAVNLGCGMPGAPFNQSTESFTSDDICIYAGYWFTPWHLDFSSTPDSRYIRGPDGKPGVAGQDDDADGVTDNDEECLASRPTTVNSGFGNKDGTGYQAGFDAAPGVAGQDDDGNGVTDDVGETGWDGTDDGDDTQRPLYWAVLQMDFNESSWVYLNVDMTASPDKDAFALREFVATDPRVMEWSNETVVGYFEAYTEYNYVVCVSGTCYGAMLWTGTDMSNPDETLGPISNTHHNGPAANAVGLGSFQWSIPGQYVRQLMFRGNSNFNDTFYVISGDARTHFPPIDADFDGDKDVDGQDFMKFSACFNGSLRPPKTGCANPEANFDGDIDVDGQDFMAFSKCFNGSLRRPKCLPPVLTICGS